MPIAPLLQKFVDDELGRAPAVIDRVLAGTLQLLRDSRHSPLNAGERSHQSALVEALQTHDASYRNAFVKALVSEVHQALVEQGNDNTAAGSRKPGGLELMDETRVEIDIEISRAMQLIDTTGEWELRELQTFTSTLVGLKHVSAESNPFRPQVYAAALWQAACVISPVSGQRTALLRVSAGVAAGLLKNAWAAACSRLEGWGIEPGTYRTVLLPAGSSGALGPAPPDANRPGSLANLLASMPTGASSARAGIGHASGMFGTGPAALGGVRMPNPAFDQALAAFDELLQQPAEPGTTHAAPSLKSLNAQRAQLVAIAESTAERQTIELIGRTFDMLLTDPYIAPSFVNVLARLQSSALRVALAEPAMFDSTRHVVWQLLDRIGESAAAYPQVGDPRSAELLQTCHQLVDTLVAVSRPDTGSYRRALNTLDLCLAAQCHTQLEQAHATVDSLQRAERRELLEQRLRQRLVDQMVNVRTTPVMRRFVTAVWPQVLAIAMLAHGETGEVTRRYIKLVDELLWSLQLPDHPQSRERLLSLLPSMLERLRAGMSSVGLPAPEQQVVLDELMTIHTEALRPRGEENTEVALTPDQIVQRIRDEVLPPSTGHGGFSDSVIDLSSMETVPAALMPSESSLSTEDPADRIDALRTGERMRLFLQGRWSRVQLLWRSEQGTLLLFASETPDETHSVTRRALERLASAGLMQPFEARPLVQRTLDAVIRQLTLPI